MTDEQFIDALKSCKLPSQEFGHSAHLRAAYLCLHKTDFASALKRVRGLIRNYAAHLGQPDRYHETMTVAYVALIQQHMYERGSSGGWENFVRENPKLLDKALLEKFYDREQLESALARKIFLMPKCAGTYRDRQAAASYE